jgi:hypothetical protein
VNNPALAVELICTVDFTVDAAATREFFMWLSHSSTIPPEAITKKQWETLIQRITLLRQFDDNWIHAFLKKAVVANPGEVIKMLRARLLAGARNFDYHGFLRIQMVSRSCGTS